MSSPRHMAAPKPAPFVRRPPGVSALTWKRRADAGIPRVLVIADVPNWAWARKAAALKTCLAGRIDVTVVHGATDKTTHQQIRAGAHDLYHTFEVSQVGVVPEGWPMTTGITAHVAQAWDPKTVRGWSARSVGFHANSIMLQREMEQLLGRPIYYVPNGVDESFFRRSRPRAGKKLVVGYVARPNPRKGAAIVEEACKRAGVELRPVVRKWKDANVLTAEQMRDYYQEIHVLAISSDMDGTPNPALEAAACECAVVSNRIGNMPQLIVDGVNGYLTERTIDGLTDALSVLAARPIEEVEAIGRAARASILADWTWKKRAVNYAAMWEQCLGIAQSAEAR